MDNKDKMPTSEERSQAYERGRTGESSIFTQSDELEKEEGRGKSDKINAEETRKENEKKKD